MALCIKFDRTNKKKVRTEMELSLIRAESSRHAELQAAEQKESFLLIQLMKIKQSCRK